MTLKEQYLVEIEFRYLDTKKDYPEDTTHIFNTITIGVFDTFEEACAKGNTVLENDFETRFSLNKNWNKKYRFGKGNGPFGTDTTLISNLAYLMTPFQFFARIVKLNYANVQDTITKAVEAEKRVIDTRSITR
jgi:hypothetical protein